MNTTYFLDLVAGNVFGSKTSPALPTAYYMGLSSTKPSADGTGITEPPADAGYARQKIDANNLGKPNNGACFNTADIDFPQSIAPWGKMTFFVLFDSEAVGSGKALMYDELDEARTVETNTILSFKAGKVKLFVTDPA